MADYGTYCTPTQFKTGLGISGAGDDARFLELLEEVSRWVDEKCDRHFYVKTATRDFTAESGNYLEVPDLLSVTSLKTDENGDRTYETTWATTDYDLETGEGRYNEFPYTLIRPTPSGDYVFPTGRRAVQIAGLWGYGTGKTATPYVDAETNTNEALDLTETGVDVGDGTKFKVGQTILVESEQMYVTVISSNTLTVVRGVNGTTAATHVTDKDIYIYQYPLQVREATLMQAARLWARRDSRFATEVGNAETGTVTVFRGKDEDIESKLRSFRRLAIGAV